MSEDPKLQDSIKKTQDLLGKYIKKPLLTDKLLRKPPFRFLHDIITAVIKETSFLKGLFTEEELNSSNIADKDGKLAYLTKLIDAMKLITGQELSVRPSKIVSGQEPIKTNELLQLIAKSLDKKISSSEAIEHYKKSLEKKQKSKRSEEKSRKPDEEKPRKTSSEEKLKKFRDAEEKRKSAASEEKPRRDRSEEKFVDKSTKKSTPSERTRSKDGIKGKEEIKKKKKHREDSGDRKSHNKKDSERLKKSKRLSSPKPLPEKVPQLKNEEPQEVEPSKDSTESIHEEKPVQEPSQVPADAPITPQPPEPALDPSNRPPEPPKSTFLRPPSARPPSARPGAPKIKGKGDFVINTNGLTQMGDVHVIVEHFDTKEDDVEGMVIMEVSPTDENLIGTSDLLDKELTKEHGYLVAQILETQRELVNEGHVEIIPNKVEIEWEAGMKKDKEIVVKEVDRLRGTIQGLTRTTNPLGKLMDFLQEDAEVMEKELWEWRGQFSDLREQLVVERSLMKESIKPLEESLKEVEGSIGGQMEKIFQAKANIMRNNQKIQKLLSGR